MSEEKKVDEIKKFWPKDAPNINNVPKYINKYKKELIVIKKFVGPLSVNDFNYIKEIIK